MPSPTSASTAGGGAVPVAGSMGPLAMGVVSRVPIQGQGCKAGAESCLQPLLLHLPCPPPQLRLYLPRSILRLHHQLLCSIPVTGKSASCPPLASHLVAREAGDEQGTGQSCLQAARREEEEVGKAAGSLPANQTAEAVSPCALLRSCSTKTSPAFAREAESRFP